MLQQARDEAHRFAIEFNRKRRSMRTVTSELLSIPGVGPSKRRALLQQFGSVQGVREASVEQIAALPGFSAVSAQRLLDHLAARAEGRTLPTVHPTPAPNDEPSAEPAEAQSSDQTPIPTDP
jgi:excinuclease ABC subunit C